MSIETDKFAVRATGSGEILAPGTYFVIRSSDVFAASGLWAYVHSMETVLELNDQARFLPKSTAQGLRALADQACQLAKTWQASGSGSLPD